MLEWDCCSYSQNNCWVMLTLTQHKKSLLMIPSDQISGLEWSGSFSDNVMFTQWFLCDTHSQHMGHGPALAGWDAHIQVCWSLYFPRRPWIPFVRAYPFKLGQGLKMILPEVAGVWAERGQKWPGKKRLSNPFKAMRNSLFFWGWLQWNHQPDIFVGAERVRRLRSFMIRNLTVAANQPTPEPIMTTHIVFFGFACLERRDLFFFGFCSLPNIYVIRMMHIYIVNDQ